MNHLSYNILILGLENNELKKLELYLPIKKYIFIYCSDYNEAINQINSGEINLVICNSEIEDDDPFKLYNFFEPFLKKNIVPFFLVVDPNKFDLVVVALEIGVDNIIFKPFNALSISRKIQNQFKKTTNRSIYNSESFLGFFEENHNPMILVHAGKVKLLNKAFSHLIGGDENRFINVKLKQLFQIENDPLKYYQYKRLESGLIPHCILDNIKLENLIDFSCELFLVRDSAGYVIAQLKIKKQKSSLSGSKLLDANSYSNFQNLENERDFVLTQREKEIYELSASGLPIKIIAERLKLSPRTVEKHRSNIMEKFGARNMIEVIKMI